MCQRSRCVKEAEKWGCARAHTHARTHRLPRSLGLEFYDPRLRTGWLCIHTATIARADALNSNVRKRYLGALTSQSSWHARISPCTSADFVQPSGDNFETIDICSEAGVCYKGGAPGVYRTASAATTCTPNAPRTISHQVYTDREIVKARSLFGGDRMIDYLVGIAGLGLFVRVIHKVRASLVTITIARNRNNLAPDVSWFASRRRRCIFLS